MKTHPSLVAFLAVGAVSLSARIAAAEGDVGDALIMNRLTPVSTFGVEIGMPIWDTADNTDLTTVGINVAGHYVDRKSGFGGYLTLPLTFVSYHVDVPLLDDVDQSDFSIGNLEVGGMYAKWFGRVGLVANIGIVAPTNSSADGGDEDSLAGAFSPLASFSVRITDLVQRARNSTWLRFGISPVGRAGKLFWRADIGADFAVDEEDGTDAASPYYHVNVGGGIDLGTASIQAELATLIIDPDDDDTDSTASVLALGARFTAGKVRPGIALLIPIGIDDYDWDFGFALSVVGRL